MPRETLAGLTQALHSGAVSSTELVTEALARADATVDLGLFHSRFDEIALTAARRLDGRRAAGADVGVLGGVPVVVKDLIATDDGPTSGGGRALDPSWGSQGDGTAVRLVRAAGGIVIGKTATSELGMGPVDPARPDGLPVPRNPWDPRRWTGGSSAGTAAAVAAGVVTAGLGTDSGGSIRMPAAFCGVTGCKPTYGLVPVDGVVPMGWSTDHVGPIAASAQDCALLLRVLTADARPVIDEAPGLDGVRVGVDPLDGADRSAHPDQPALFARAIGELAAAGARLDDVTLPFYPQLASASIVTTLSEALAYHRDALVRRWSDFLPSTREVFALGAFVTGADYVAAQRVRRAARDDVDRFWGDVDVIATPTAAIVAPEYERLGDFFPDGGFFAVHATYWNLTGHPAVSVPIGLTSDGYPLAMQLVGRRGADRELLALAAAYQRVTDWHRLVAPPAAS